MTNCASIFTQILSFFNRGEFADIVRKHKAEKRAKGFCCWDQFVAIENDVYFVTRMKDNDVYAMLEEHRPPRNSTIISDQIIRLTGDKAADRA